MLFCFEVDWRFNVDEQKKALWKNQSAFNVKYQVSSARNTKGLWKSSTNTAWESTTTKRLGFTCCFVSRCQNVKG